MLERAKETTRCGKYTYIEYAIGAASLWPDISSTQPLLKLRHRR